MFLTQNIFYDNILTSKQTNEVHTCYFKLPIVSSSIGMFVVFQILCNPDALASGKRPQSEGSRRQTLFFLERLVAGKDYSTKWLRLKKLRVAAGEVGLRSP